MRHRREHLQQQQQESMQMQGVHEMFHGVMIRAPTAAEMITLV